MEALRAYRKDNKLSQKAAAEIVGVYRESWARWETGMRKIDRKKLSDISQRTGIPKRVLRPDLAEIMREVAL